MWSGEQILMNFDENRAKEGNKKRNREKPAKKVMSRSVPFYEYHHYLNIFFNLLSVPFIIKVQKSRTDGHRICWPYTFTIKYFNVILFNQYIKLIIAKATKFKCAMWWLKWNKHNYWHFLKNHTRVHAIYVNASRSTWTSTTKTKQKRIHVHKCTSST